MNSKRKNRLVTLLTIMAVAVCSVFGSPIQAKAAASDIAVLDQLSAQAQYPVVMNLGAYDEATGGVLNALATQAFASWASDNYINYEYISIDEMYIAPFSSTLAYAEMTAPFTSLLTEVAASEDGDTLIAAMQYALMIHYSYISSANEAVSKIVYGFLSASDGTYIGFAGTDDTSSRQADTSAQASNNSSSTAMCWLSATGSKYHSINNCGRMNPNNARQVTIAEAERQGYGRCKKCW